EHSHAAQRRRRRRRQRRLDDWLFPPPQRQPHLEGRSEVVPAARRGNSSAVKLDHVPDDAEAEAEAAMLARGTAVALTETLEEMYGDFRGESDAGVGHDQIGRASCR